MSRFMRNNQGGGRDKDDEKFLALHKDIIEQVDVEFVGKKIKEGHTLLRKLPLMFSILVVFGTFIAGVTVSFFVFLSLVNIMRNFGTKRRLYIISLIAILTSVGVVMLYALLAVRP